MSAQSFITDADNQIEDLCTKVDVMRSALLTVGEFVRAVDVSSESQLTRVLEVERIIVDALMQAGDADEHESRSVVTDISIKPWETVVDTWFAWHPVRVGDQFAWLRRVSRIRFYGATIYKHYQKGVTMDAETLAFRHDRHLDALMDAANDEAHANAERNTILVAQQSAENWQKMVDQPGFTSELIGDWTADPQAELAEIYRELAKVKAGLICIEDAARIVFRNIDRRVDEISQSQVEEKS